MTQLSAKFRSVLLVPLVLGLGACAGGGITVPGPEAPEPGADYRGVPGFDTRTYPGDGVMRQWLEASPYRWVGYYLPAPCHTGTSWMGKREQLRATGWGIAVLFVGEQDWATSRDAAAADTAAGEPAAGEEPRCTSANLSRERGRRDGADAASAARAEGFPAGTVVYLDVEPVETVSDSLAAYVAGWTVGLRQAGYAPGLYAHARNADRLRAIMADADDGVRPRLWVASPSGFNLRRAPAESGYPATIWQGLLDTRETWAGTTLRIDANVADRADPSAPGG